MVRGTVIDMHTHAEMSDVGFDSLKRKPQQFINVGVYIYH